MIDGIDVYLELSFECRVYALSASKAIFRARI